MPEPDEEDEEVEGQHIADDLNPVIPQPAPNMPRAGLAYRDHFAATHFR